MSCQQLADNLEPWVYWNQSRLCIRSSFGVSQIREGLGPDPAPQIQERGVEIPCRKCQGWLSRSICQALFDIRSLPCLIQEALLAIQLFPLTIDGSRQQWDSTKVNSPLYHRLSIKIYHICRCRIFSRILFFSIMNAIHLCFWVWLDWN